jgi:hypothetical protein
MHRYISWSVDHCQKSLDKLKKRQEKEKEMVADRLTQLYFKEKWRYEQ